MDTARSNRPIRSIAAVSVCLVLAPAIGLGGEAPQPDGYHRAVTDAEKAVDVTLKNSLAKGLAAYVRGWAERDKSKDHRFARNFTPALVTAWRAAEAEQAKINCGGEYIEGDMCGIEGNPITCAQDFSPDGYLYRTEKADRDSAIITYRWPDDRESVATYRMVRLGKRWLMDGVECPSYLKFNMD